MAKVWVTSYGTAAADIEIKRKGDYIMGFFGELTRARMMELSGEKIAYAARAKKNH